MRIPLILILLAPCFSYAADRPALTSGSRYEDNYAFLADPAKRTDFLDPIKYIPLSDDSHTYLSFGGEIRERYEAYINNPFFGIGNPSHDNYLMSRALLHADLHVTPYFRSFVQFGHHDIFDKESQLLSVDHSKADLQQAFAETILPLENQQFILRVGRQEIILGSQRLVSNRESPNVRQSYDAVRGIYQQGDYHITIFGSHPVTLNPDNFDDETNESQTLSGVYTVMPITGALHSDLYYLEYERERARFPQGTGQERRHTVGTRLWDTTSDLDYNFEFTYQWGHFGNGNISAWMAASDTGYKFRSLPWNPHIGLKADYITGDNNLNDNNLETFDSLYPRGSYFSETSLIAPLNLIRLQPNLRINPLHDVTVTIGADFLWRESTQDSVYRMPNVPFNGIAGQAGRYTGTQAFILSTWQIDRHASITATYMHFDMGDGIKAAGGGDVDYIASWMTYRF